MFKANSNEIIKNNSSVRANKTVKILAKPKNIKKLLKTRHLK